MQILSDKIMHKEIDNIIKIIKAFNGDIIGGFVRDRYAGVTTTYLPPHLQKEPTAELRDLDCRIDKNMLMCFVNVMNVQYHIYERPTSPNYIRMDVVSYMVSKRDSNNTDGDGRALQLDVLCCSVLNWHTYAIDFDVNLLTENINSLQIRPIICAALANIPDRFNHVMKRLRQRTFACPSLPVGNFDDILVLIMRSADLVKRRWTMDDYYMGALSWVVARWSTLRTTPTKVRTKQATHERSIMTQRKDCCLCHENFVDDDIVFNSGCNHNFHWQCGGVPGAGIHEWFSVKRGFACPCCRQETVIVRNWTPMTSSHLLTFGTVPPVATGTGTGTVTGTTHSTA